ncbi:unnamed protein product [Meloidogyne enterolobii]|uniref:Uncharacterized protein n=1 Tax=Meloidogyne enterolobii TaxID=390850 RepID=A0ACB1B478_MELEN
MGWGEVIMDENSWGRSINIMCLAVEHLLPRGMLQCPALIDGLNSKGEHILLFGSHCWSSEQEGYTKRSKRPGPTTTTTAYGVPIPEHDLDHQNLLEKNLPTSTTTYYEVMGTTNGNEGSGDMDICRVCRLTGNDALYHLRLRTGSIKYVHQDCLLQWLSTAKRMFVNFAIINFPFVPSTELTCLNVYH